MSYAGLRYSHPVRIVSQENADVAESRNLRRVTTTTGAHRWAFQIGLEPVPAFDSRLEGIEAALAQAGQREVVQMAPPQRDPPSTGIIRTSGTARQGAESIGITGSSRYRIPAGTFMTIGDSATIRNRKLYRATETAERSSAGSTTMKIFPALDRDISSGTRVYFDRMFVTFVDEASITYDERGMVEHTLSVVEALEATPPVKPIAQAGVDQSVRYPGFVTLDGSRSSDPDGQIRTYTWTQLFGPYAMLSSPRIARPRFSLPIRADDYSMRFRLAVSDNDGNLAFDDTDVFVAVPSTLWLVLESFPTQRLWRINPANPGSTSGDFGSLGELPRAFSFDADALAFGDGKWLSIHNPSGSGSAEIWSLNPSDPADESGSFGYVGSMPGAVSEGTSSATGIAFGDGRWYVLNDRSLDAAQLWRLNDANPGDETGPYGLVGALPSALQNPRGMSWGVGEWLVINRRLGNTAQLWRINVNDPDDTSGDFGLIGSLPSGLDDAQGIAYAAGDWLVIDDPIGDSSLWRINVANPSDTSGRFGRIGALPSNMLAPRGFGAF